MLSGRDNVFRLSSWRQDGEASAGADPGASDVELSMREAGLQQVQAGHLQILSLGLVDGYGVGEANGKLQPLELDGEIRRNNGILGMKVSSPLAQPVMMVAWMTLGMRALTMSRVPLQSLGASKLRSSMIGADTFRLMT